MSHQHTHPGVSELVGLQLAGLPVVWTTAATAFVALSDALASASSVARAADSLLARAAGLCDLVRWLSDAV